MNWLITIRRKAVKREHMVQIDLEKIEARSQSKKKIPTCVGIMTNEAVLKSKL